MAPRLGRLLAPLLLVGGAAASGQSAPSAQCTAVLSNFAGSEVELAVLCRAQLPPEQCQAVKSELGSQPWSAEKVAAACSGWDRWIHLLQSQGVDATLKDKQGVRQEPTTTSPTTTSQVARVDAINIINAPTTPLSSLASAASAPSAPVQVPTVPSPPKLDLEDLPGMPTSTTTNTDIDRLWIRRFRSRSQEDDATGINRLPGGAAILREMGLQSVFTKEGASGTTTAAPTVFVSGATGAFPLQKWAAASGRDVPARLRHAFVSGVAWPFCALLALVMAAAAAPALRRAWAQPDVSRETFAPLVQFEWRAQPAGPVLPENAE